MKKYLVAGLFLVGGLLVPIGADAAPKPHCTHHTIKVSKRPFKALGSSAKSLATSAGKFTFATLDTLVIDPAGVVIQGAADALDMAVAAPLEAAPPPANYIGLGVHFVYFGLDWAGVQLAK